MNQNLEDFILSATGAKAFTFVEEIQSLWSGYGAIRRYALEGLSHKSIVIKHVKLPHHSAHPKGWNTDLSHQRKIKSYRVESAWYRDYGSRCDSRCRIPSCLGLEASDDEFVMMLEDLDLAGYPHRKDVPALDNINTCLRWLAYFHATFLGEAAVGLWEQGSYWYLETRPDELNALSDEALKQAAFKIDQLLQSCPYQTIIHGDAKLANFCFSEDGKDVAAVDFQYVGGGCGMKDVAYFIGSCLDDEGCERHANALLAVYFAYLSKALEEVKPTVDAAAVEAAWRPLFKIAWVDFHRFLKGWSPGHWKLHGYSERIAREVLERLADGCD